jgi:hypothetical protein
MSVHLIELARSGSHHHNPKGKGNNPNNYMWHMCVNNCMPMLCICLVVMIIILLLFALVALIISLNQKIIIYFTWNAVTRLFTSVQQTNGHQVAHIWVPLHLGEQCLKLSSSLSGEGCALRQR